MIQSPPFGGDFFCLELGLHELKDYGIGYLCVMLMLIELALKEGLLPNAVIL